jgi:hypothetical protein
MVALFTCAGTSTDAHPVQTSVQTSGYAPRRARPTPSYRIEIGTARVKRITVTAHPAMLFLIY